MGLEARLQTHRSKLKKESNDNTFRYIKNTGNPEATGQFHHTSMTSGYVVRRYPTKVMYMTENRHIVPRTPIRKMG